MLMLIENFDFCILGDVFVLPLWFAFWIWEIHFFSGCSVLRIGVSLSVCSLNFWTKLSIAFFPLVFGSDSCSSLLSRLFFLALAHGVVVHFRPADLRVAPAAVARKPARFFFPLVREHGERWLAPTDSPPVGILRKGLSTPPALFSFAPLPQLLLAAARSKPELSFGFLRQGQVCPVLCLVFVNRESGCWTFSRWTSRTRVHAVADFTLLPLCASAAPELVYSLRFSVSQSHLLPMFLAVWVILRCCRWKPGCVLESSDQKTRGFLVRITLPWAFSKRAH
jgi:hypothetical protein